MLYKIPVDQYDYKGHRGSISGKMKTGLLYRVGQPFVTGWHLNRDLDRWCVLHGLEYELTWESVVSTWYIHMDDKRAAILFTLSYGLDG